MTIKTQAILALGIRLSDACGTGFHKSVIGAAEVHQGLIARRR
ncbi:MAG: hypothetical protein OXH92_06730 [Bryobacterales bacterium]|nr:hypothetical protein [Bryobacterales bacterium]MDE0295529.1 hypothetical protein [Bryobacterales bacterium]MDE0433688.1 hypothetical protein [Bryobacterales bacterium]